MERNNTLKIKAFFPLFCDFSLQKFWSIKLTEISRRRTTNTIFCSPQTCCLSLVNKKAIFQGLMTKYLQSFKFKFQKGQILDKFLYIFADISGKKNLIFFFFVELLINYVGVILPSFKLCDLVQPVLWLYIENTSKSNWIPGLQTVWSVKLTFVRKFRIANITFLKPQMYTYSLI